MADGLFSSLLQKSKGLPAEWNKVLAPNSAAYEAAVLLNASGKLPKINFSSIPEGGVSGEYDKKTNSITIDLSKNKTETTLPHELTHALRYALQSKAREIGDAALQTGKFPSEIDKQFYDAWYKLDPDFSKLTPMQYPDRNYQQYRFSFNEAPAWAVGNMENPQKSFTKGEYVMTSPGGGHYDATMATEQAILRDLYARQLNQKPTTPWWKDPFGNTIGASIR